MSIVTLGANGEIKNTVLTAHTLADTSGLGSLHTVSGLTAGQVLRATGATAAAFQSLVAGDLPTHDILSKHSYSGGAALDLFGLSAASTLAKLTPSSNPGGAAAILATTIAGLLTLAALNVSGNVGIGTTEPTAPLQVRSATAGVSAELLNSSIANFTSEASAPAGNSYGIVIGKEGSHAMYIGLNKNTATGAVPANSIYYGAYTTWPLVFGHNFGQDAGAATADMTILSNGNVGIGTTVFGASAAGILALGGTATAPTTSVDLVHLYSEDISADNRALAIYAETAAIAAIAIASTHKIPIRYNGATYYLLASNV